MKHILLVDDEPEILEGLALMLKPIPNVCIHTACLASQALQVMQQQPVSLVIADIRMPGMSGIEMWEQIQKIAPSCRVIFLSGVRDFDNIYRVIQSPGARFLTKMEPEEKIISTVEEILSEVEDQQQQQLNSQFAKLAAYLMEEKHTHAFLPESACSCALSASKFFAFAFLTPACKWSMSAHERREALQIFFDALYDQCKQAKPHFLSLHDSQAVLLLPIPSPETMENDFLPCLRQVCTLLEGQPRHMYRCAYGALRFSADTLHTHYHNFLHWHSLENVPQTFLLPIQELNPPAHAQKLQSEFSHHLRTLQGYAKLGQCEGFLQLTMKMLQSSEQPQDAILWLDHYYSILALLYQQLEAVHDSSLRESIAAEANVPLQDKSAREKAQERLSLYIHQVFAQLFPADPYAHPDMVQSIQRYIRDHLAEDLSLNALSQRFAMHPSYLSRIFRENAGYRLHEYISSLRMSFAAQVLVSSNMRINEIARKAGYDSVHTFIRSFRKQFGCTPAEYRSQNRHTT